VAMGREALALFCIDADEVNRVERVYRDRDRERLDSQTASGDLHAMSETMFRPDNPLGARPAE
jgi:glutathione-regulated potassium-efflux system protein KefB